MNRLQVINAIYYDPKLGFANGTIVTEELFSLIRNDVLLYEGSYNDVFPDEFERIHKKLRVEINYRGKGYTKIYNEDDKINLPNDLGVSRKLNINNPWLVAIGGSIIMLIVGSMFFKQPTFIYNQNAGNNESKKNSENNIFESYIERNNIEQNNSGGGDNVAGNKIIINNQEEGQDSNVDKRELFEDDIYLLPDRADALTTTLEKENLFKKFNGLLVKSHGFITDVSKYNSLEVVDSGDMILDTQEVHKYLTTINPANNNETSNYIMCTLNESWGKKLETIKVPFETRFSGTISSVMLGVVYLTGCQLE